MIKDRYERTIDTAEAAIDMLAPKKKDKTRLKPWFVLQVSAPWTGEGAEQSWRLTQEKVIAFLREYPEDTQNREIFPSLRDMTDDELDRLADGTDSLFG